MGRRTLKRGVNGWEAPRLSCLLLVLFSRLTELRNNGQGEIIMILGALLLPIWCSQGRSTAATAICMPHGSRHGCCYRTLQVPITGWRLPLRCVSFDVCSSLHVDRPHAIHTTRRRMGLGDSSSHTGELASNSRAV